MNDAVMETTYPAASWNKGLTFRRYLRNILCPGLLQQSDESGMRHVIVPRGILGTPINVSPSEMGNRADR